MITFIFLIFALFLQLSTAGGRLIISSDGVWDSLSVEAALDCCHGMLPDAAAAQIVKVHRSMKNLFRENCVKVHTWTSTCMDRS